MAAELLLGIDGGGSTSRAVLADAQGRILGVGTTGSSNLQIVGLEGVVAAVEVAIQAARRAAGVASDAPVNVACLGLAGVDRPGDRERVSTALRVRSLAERLLLVSDSELVLAAGCPEGWGLALVSGTGSICFGRAPDGRTARAGGWGYLLGDEGSGFAIAQQALRLAARTADGRAEAHELLEAALAFWGLTAPEELVPLVYQRVRGAPAALAWFAPRVLDLASAGDPHATAIVEEAATELARSVEVVRARLELNASPLALGGGILLHSSLLRERLLGQLPSAVGPVTLVEEATRGAVHLALQELHARA